MNSKAGSKKGGSAGGEAEEDRGEHQQHGTRRRKHAALAATEVVTWGQPQNGDVRHLNNTRSMVERAKPDTRPKPLLA